MFLVSTGESKEAYFHILLFLQNCVIFFSPSIVIILGALDYRNRNPGTSELSKKEQ